MRMSTMMALVEVIVAVILMNILYICIYLSSIAVC